MIAPATPALEVIGLNKRFGALHVTRDVNLSLMPGARTALIGPNGAGKTTFVNLITGVVRPDQGRLSLFGEDITERNSAQRTRRGLVRTFQISNLFNGLTVFENIFIAVTQAAGRSFQWWRPAGEQVDLLHRTHALMAFLRLEEDCHHPIAQIAYGRRRLVEIAIALAMKPRVLLLDEPAAGIPSNELDLLHQAIASLPADIAVLMIEHDMEMVRRFASEISVLVDGALLLSGSPQAVMADDTVRSVYLGSAGRRRFDAQAGHA